MSQSKQDDARLLRNDRVRINQEDTMAKAAKKKAVKRPVGRPKGSVNKPKKPAKAAKKKRAA